MNTDNFTFYYGAASGSARKALRRLDEKNVMINYATANNTRWDGIENLFVDSGGYSFMKGKGEYETSEAAYLDYVTKVSPEVFALRDYPCEPDILEKFDRSVREHQRRTIEKHRRLFELLDDRTIEAEPLAVLQGWTKDDYLRHIEQMDREGLLTDRVGIGSVCRRGQDEQIREIINAVAEVTTVDIHAFGVKANVLRFEDVRDNLRSADSLAYEMGSQYEANICNTHKRCFRDLAYKYLEFKQRINRLMEGENLTDIPFSQKSLRHYSDDTESGTTNLEV